MGSCNGARPPAGHPSKCPLQPAANLGLTPNCCEPVKEPEQPQAKRQLHPLPKGLVELYGLLAVLFVLVPEWMAGSALFGFASNRTGSELPPAAAAWRKLPELRLANMTLAELRLLARQLRLRGYASLGRDRLTARLLARLKRRKANW